MTNEEFGLVAIGLPRADEEEIDENLEAGVDDGEEHRSKIVPVRLPLAPLNTDALYAPDTRAGCVAAGTQIHSSRTPRRIRR